MSAAACTVRAERPGPRPRRACRPCLTPLEDRVALSTLAVTSSADDGSQHTLRWAVENAQNGDTIQLTGAIEGPIVLTQGELLVTHDVTIQSVPARTPTISGGGNSRVFEIAAGATVTLGNLQLSDGVGTEDGQFGDDGQDGPGGAILNLGTLTVSDSILSNNAAVSRFGGGAIANGGKLTVSDSTFSHNTATFGGGIYNLFLGTGATATVTGSTFSHNTATFGGAIYNFGGTLSVATSVFYDNKPDNIVNLGTYHDLGGNQGLP
jgi:hypothetical protein